MKNFVVKLDRLHTYRHLHALCQNDALFAISNFGEEVNDDDLERIAISDLQMIRKQNQGSARGAIIGTVRLLPAGNLTTVMFVSKDPYWNEPISETGRLLFTQFISRAKEHFLSLELIQAVQTVETNDDKQLEVEVLRTKLNGLFSQLKIQITNLNGLQIEKAKYGTTGIPVRLERAIEELEEEIAGLETRIKEVKAQLAILGVK